MAFFWWSDTESSYRDMESIDAECEKCQGIQKHTLRYYIQKSKSYSVLTTSTKRNIVAICHGCLQEKPLDPKYEDEKVNQFESQILTWEAHEQIEKGNYRKALKKLEKALKKDPENPQTLFAKASTLIDFGQKEEAKPILSKLLEKFPDSEDVIALKEKSYR